MDNPLLQISVWHSWFVQKEPPNVAEYLEHEREDWQQVLHIIPSMSLWAPQVVES